ncbi:MAG: methyl-accepting chemotaxis protein [Planctomycetota bacterium]
MTLIVENKAKEANAFLDTQKTIFEKWTNEDIYGLAIEFDTADELKKQFDTMLTEAPDFSVLLLANKKGELFQAHQAADFGQIEVSSLRGKVYPEVSNAAKNSAPSVVYDTSGLLKNIGAPYQKTYIFTSPCKGPSGDINGTLVAFVDRNVFQNKVMEMEKTLQDSGYPEARTSILDPATLEVIAGSKTDLVDTTLTFEEPLKKWLNDYENEGKPMPYEMVGGPEYIAFASIKSPEGMMAEDEAAAKKAYFPLMAFVPESNILAEVQKGLTSSIIIVTIGGLVLMLVFWLLSKMISKPLIQITASAQAISSGNLDQEILVTSKDEIGSLADSLRDMVGSIRKSIATAQQKVNDLNNIPTPVFRVDKDYTIQFINNAGAEMVKMTPEQAEGRKCYDLFKTTHCNTQECRCRQAMAMGTTRQGEAIADPDALNLPVKYIAQPVRNNQGEITGATEFIVDISSEKEAQVGVTETSVVLGNVVTEVTSIVGEMDKKTEEIAMQTNSVADAAEMMSTTMDEASRSAEQSQENIKDVAKATEQLNETVAEIAQNSEKARSVAEYAVTSVAEASAKMNKLGVAANEISKVIETIIEIAEQTKLLALNATIEAARAGEAGKGFAVVASEVKELAKQTNNATEDIRSKVEAIQTTSESTISEIGKITSVINEVNEFVSTIATAVEEQSITTREIAGNISQASTGVHEMTEKVVQSVNVAKEVSGNITAVNRDINNIKNTTARLAKSGNDLKKTGDDLNSMIAMFN